MELIIGNCSKHPGFNMINCPMCEVERQKKISNQFWNNVTKRKPLCLTNWGAVLQVEEEKKALLRVSDPKAIDAGQYISWCDVKAIFRFKSLIN